MKKTLKEELERIHQLTYGPVINEQGDFLNTIKKKIDTFIGKRDDPKRADYVSPDVEEFFNTLEFSVKNGGLTQQRKGSMTYQKEVESMQIGLQLLGYQLPRYGVDGLFGPETASAVSKFTIDNLTNKTENINESSMVQLNTVNYSNIKTDEDETKYDSVNKALLDDIQTAASNAGVNVKITTAKSGHNKYAVGSNRVSRHMTGAAVDISKINDKPVISNREDTNKFVDELIKLGYVKNKESGNPKAVLTYGFPNHDNHVHISNNIGVSGGSDVKKDVKLTQASPEMLQKLIDQLKDRGVKSEDLRKYTDKTIDTSDIKDTNFYVKLLEELGAPTSEENLKFLLAWRQAEGKAGKYNPFNTTQKMAGATNYNDVGVKNYLTLEDGFVATVKTLKNGKYNCILDGLRNDIGADRIAQCKSLQTWGTGDLVTKVLSGYKKGSNPKDIPLA